MTYKEFKEWCKENEYTVLESEKYIGVIDEELNTLCGVSKVSEMACDVRTGNRELIDKTLELALTPLEKREEEKKYHVVLEGVFSLENSLYRGTHSDHECVCSFANGGDNIFTKEEAEEIIKNIKVEMVEIEE